MTMLEASQAYLEECLARLREFEASGDHLDEADDAMARDLDAAYHDALDDLSYAEYLDAEEDCTR